MTTFNTKGKAVDFGATGVSRYFSGSPPTAPTGDFALLVVTKRNNTPGASENLLKVGAALGNLAKTTTDGQYNWLTPLAGSSVVSSSLTDTDDKWVLVAGIRTGTNYQIHVIEFGSITVHSGNVVVDAGTFAIDLLEIGESATSREQVAFTYSAIAEGTITTDQLIALANYADPQSLARIHGWGLQGLWRLDAKDTSIPDLSGAGNALLPSGTSWPDVVDAPSAPETVLSWAGTVSGFSGTQTPALDIPAGDFAVLALTRPDAVGAGNRKFFDTDAYYLERRGVSTYRFRTTSAGNFDKNVSSPVATGEWIWVIGRRLGGFQDAFIVEHGKFGIAASVVPGANSGTAAATKLSVGDGQINDDYAVVAKVDGALTDGLIEQIGLQSDVLGFLSKHVSVKAYWSLIDDVGSVDLSGFGHNVAQGANAPSVLDETPFAAPRNTIALDRGAVEPYENGIIPTPQAVDFGANNDAVSLRQFTGTFDSSIYVATDQPVALFVWAQSVHGTTYDERLMWYAGFRLLRRGVDGQYRFEAGSGDNNIQSTANGTHSDGKWRLICGIRRPGNLCEIRVIEMGTTNVITGTTISTGLQGNQNQILFGTGNVSHVYRGVTAAGMVVFDADPTDDQLVALANYADPEAAARLNGWDVRGYWKLPNTDSDLIDLSQYGRDLSRSGTGWSTDATTVDAPQAPETAVDFGAGNAERIFRGTAPVVAASTPFTICLLTYVSQTPPNVRVLAGVRSRTQSDSYAFEKSQIDTQFNFGFDGNQFFLNVVPDATASWRLLAIRRDTSNNIIASHVEAGSTVITSSLPTNDSGGVSPTFPLGIGGRGDIGDIAWCEEEIRYCFVAEGFASDTNLIALAAGQDPLDLGSRYGWNMLGYWQADNITELPDLSGNGLVSTAQGANWPTPVAFEQTPRNTLVAWRGGVERVAPAPETGVKQGEILLHSVSLLTQEADAIYAGELAYTSNSLITLDGEKPGGPIPEDGEVAFSSSSTIILDAGKTFVGEILLPSTSLLTLDPVRALQGEIALTSDSVFTAEGVVPTQLQNNALDFGNPNNNSTDNHFVTPYDASFLQFTDTGAQGGSTLRPACVAVWIKFPPGTNDGTAFSYFFSSGSISSDGTLNLYVSNKQAANNPNIGWIYWGGYTTVSSGQQILDDGVWRLFVAQVNPPGNAGFYRLDVCDQNGTVVEGTRRTNPGFDLNTNAPLFVGKRGYDNDNLRYHRAHIHTVTIWDGYALTASEIGEIAGGQYGPDEVAGKPPVAHWDIRGDTGNIPSSINSSHVLERFGTGTWTEVPGPFGDTSDQPSTAIQPNDRGNVDLANTVVTDPLGATPQIAYKPRLTGDATTNRHDNHLLEVTQMAGKTPTFVYDYADHAVPGEVANLALYWAYSVQGPWTKFDNITDDTLSETKTADHNTAFTQDSVYVCEQEVATLQTIANLVTTVGNDPLGYDTATSGAWGQGFGEFNQMTAQTDETSRAIPAVAMQAFRLLDVTKIPPWGTNKLPVVLCVGAQASEDVQHYVLEAIVNDLTGPDTYDLMSRCEFFVYPLVNPSGRVGGHFSGDFQINNGQAPSPRTRLSWGLGLMECLDKHEAAIAADTNSTIAIHLTLEVNNTLANKCINNNITDPVADAFVAEMASKLGAYTRETLNNPNMAHGYFDNTYSSPLSVSHNMAYGLTGASATQADALLSALLETIDDPLNFFAGYKSPPTPVVRRRSTLLVT